MGRRSEWPLIGACRLAVCLLSCLTWGDWLSAVEVAGGSGRTALAADARTSEASLAVPAHMALVPEASPAVPEGGTPLSPPSSRSRSPRSPNLLNRTMVWNAARVGALLALFGVWVILQRTWLARRQGASGQGVVHVFGKVALDARQQLHFVRVGRRLLVLLQGPQGLQHVTEIDDPEEVARVLSHWNPAATGESPRAGARDSTQAATETGLADDYRSFAEGVREGAFGLSLQPTDARHTLRDSRSATGLNSSPRSNSYFA
jgi:flagellar biogenesis protein FliO